MEEGTISLNRKERDRLRLIHEVERGHISGVEAAEALGVSTRQFKRILKRQREEGDKGLAHRLRGKSSNRGMPRELRDEVLSLIREKYPDFGPTFASEKLDELHGIKLSDETVRKLMIADGIRKARKRKERHRKRRERRSCFGELIQMDGSHHDWLEGRGPKMVLMVMIDDATSEVRALFGPAEETRAGMLMLRIWLEEFGRPRAIYADRHSIWVTQKGDAGEREDSETTQLGRALRELEISYIPAGSPQAKGRVERQNGTLQDRLVKELRLAGIDNMEDANRFLTEVFLPRHNAKFRKEPASRANAHRKLYRAFDLDHILSEQEERTVQNDYTIRWRNRFFQIHKPVPSGLRGGKVIVALHLDGSLHLVFKNKQLKWDELNEHIHTSTICHTTPRGSIHDGNPSPLPKPKVPWVPPPDHPWKRSYKRPH
jgi:transposase